MNTNFIALKLSNVVAATVILSACSGIGAVSSGIGAMGAAVGMSAATTATVVADVNTAYQAGQLFCSYRGVIAGIIDSQTKSAFLVTGKTANAVATACSYLEAGSVPVVTPITPAAVPTVAIIVTPATLVVASTK